VVSDPHVSTRRAGTWKCFHRTERRLRDALADAAEVGVDGVVVSGDLTEDGHPPDFECVHDAVAGVDAPVLAVPGNHDVPKSWDDHESPSAARFARRFAPGGFPFRTRVRGVDVVGVDTASGPALADTHGGGVDEAARARLGTVLAGAETPLVVGHHNLSAKLHDVDVDAWRSAFPLRGHESFAATLSAGGASLYLSGHLHLPAVGRVGDVCEAVLPALSTFPQGYTLVTVGPTGTTLRYRPVADADGVAEAYMSGIAGTTHSEVSVRTAGAQFASLPLVDERD
jgi:3',5'-cyclic AMP phosphodiesterase CpdA